MRRREGMARPQTNIGKCRAEKCDRDAEVDLLCRKHYKRLRKHGNVHYKGQRGGATKRLYGKDEKCAINGCGNKIYAKYLCVNHYNQVRSKKLKQRPVDRECKQEENKPNKCNRKYLEGRISHASKRVQQFRESRGESPAETHTYYGGWDLGYWEGKLSAYEDMLDKTRD